MALVGIAIFFYNLAAPHRSKPMATESNRLVPYLSIIGVAGFTTAMGMLFYNPKYRDIGLWMGGGSLLCGVISILLNAATARAKRSAWPVVSARCTRQVLTKSQSADNRVDWSWQIICEVDYAGKKHHLSPKVRWSDVAQADLPFGKEAKARKFLAQRVSPDGQCQLRINPANPSEAELIG